MPSTYTGSWLRNAYKDPIQAVVHTADPAHEIVGQVDLVPIVHEAPVLTPAAPNGEYPGSEWTVVTPGVILNTTSWEDHAQGNPTGSYATDVEARMVSSAAHDIDQGGPEQSIHYEKPLQFADEHYTSTRVEGLDTSVVSEKALRRGLNGDPQNNPEGFRKGFTSDWWVYRKFAVPPAGDRMHDMHVLTPNTAQAIPSLPPNDSPYGSPYASQARAMTRTWSLPSVRREPPPMDTWSQTDGLDQVSEAFDTWVVG